jgi:transposase-like protein
MTRSGAGSAFSGFRFPRKVVSVAVRWYLRYGLSYRDVESCSPNAQSLLIM